MAILHTGTLSFPEVVTRFHLHFFGATICRSCHLRGSSQVLPEIVPTCASTTVREVASKTVPLQLCPSSWAWVCTWPPPLPTAGECVPRDTLDHGPETVVHGLV